MGSYIGDDASGSRNEISQDGKLLGVEANFKDGSADSNAQ
jgi:hypothetical protein